MKNRLAMTHMSHAIQRSSSRSRQEFAGFLHVFRDARRAAQTPRVASVKDVGPYLLLMPFARDVARRPPTMRRNAAGPSAAFSKRQAAGDQIAASYLRARSRSFFLTGRKSHPASPLVNSPNRLSRRSPLYQPLVQPSR